MVVSVKRGKTYSLEQHAKSKKEGSGPRARETHLRRKQSRVGARCLKTAGSVHAACAGRGGGVGVNRGGGVLFWMQSKKAPTMLV